MRNLQLDATRKSERKKRVAKSTRRRKRRENMTEKNIMKIAKRLMGRSMLKLFTIILFIY